MKIKTPYNAKEFPQYAETNTLPSCTIPDQTMSLSQLLERYARGLPIDGVASIKTPIYHGEDWLPDLRKMDLSEIHELIQQNTEYIQEKQTQLAAIQSAHANRVLKAQSSPPQNTNNANVITDLEDIEEVKPRSSRKPNKE